MIRLVLFFFLSSLFVTNAVAADDPNEAAIEARTSEMALRKFYVGPLFAMAKGDMEYDAELAAQNAGSLIALSKIHSGNMWPQGSHMGAYPELSGAKEAVWTTYPEIAEYGKTYKEAITALAAEAGNGLDGLRKTIGPVGKSCKGCHDEYREKN